MPINFNLYCTLTELMTSGICLLFLICLIICYPYLFSTFKRELHESYTFTLFLLSSCVFCLMVPVSRLVHLLLPLRFSLTFICLCLWIIRCWLSLRISLMSICLCLWIIHFVFPLRFSLTFSCLCFWIIRYLFLRISLTFISLYLWILYSGLPLRFSL